MSEHTPSPELLAFRALNAELLTVLAIPELPQDLLHTEDRDIRARQATQRVEDAAAEFARKPVTTWAGLAELYEVVRAAVWDEHSDTMLFNNEKLQEALMRALGTLLWSDTARAPDKALPTTGSDVHA